MKNSLGTLTGVLIVLMLAGCGGEDRGALATTTVRTYWNNIEHGKWNKAYTMITSSNRRSVTLTDYGQRWADFLSKQTHGVKAIIGKPAVKGDCADVPVTLKSPSAPNPKDDLHARQDLFWEKGTWKISNPDGQLSNLSTAGCA